MRTTTKRKKKPVRSERFLSNAEHNAIHHLKDCEKTRIRYVSVKLEDLRHLYRCAQLIQMHLNNRITQEKDVCGDVSIVPRLEMKHGSVLKVIRDVVSDVERVNKVALTPSSFI